MLSDSPVYVVCTPPSSPQSLHVDLTFAQEIYELRRGGHSPRRQSHCSTNFFRRNVVQRVISAAVLAPAVTIFLWLSPALATTTVCSFLMSTCSYEYACLANRIRLRILTRLDALEASSTATSPRRHRSPQSTSVNSVSSVKMRSSCVERESTSTRKAQDTELVLMDYELNDQNGKLQCCAVTGLASRYFCGHEWLAAFLVALVVCIITSAVLPLSLQQVPELKNTEFYGYRCTFAFSTSFVLGLSASFTPDWQYGVIMFIKYVVFMFLTLNSIVCPMNEGGCTVTLSSSNIFLIGLLVVLLFRVVSSKSNTAAFINFMLDVLGLVYITGSLSVLVSFVDDDCRKLYRKLLIALLHIVWASDTGAYLVGKILVLFKYPYYNPLAPHLSRNKDYEGTVGAIAFGIMAMLVTSQLLDLPGSFGSKVTYTIVAVVAGRLGDLFESLLKRAAGVKDSGKLIPGHGGALDRIDALMFATIVFSRYYALHT